MWGFKTCVNKPNKNVPYFEGGDEIWGVFSLENKHTIMIKGYFLKRIFFFDFLFQKKNLK